MRDRTQTLAVVSLPHLHAIRKAARTWDIDLSANLVNGSVVSNLAQHLDLNSLHDLAATCRQFHANLTQYRPQLV